MYLQNIAPSRMPFCICRDLIKYYVIQKLGTKARDKDTEITSDRKNDGSYFKVEM